MEEQESTVSVKSIGLKWGAISGLIGIILLVIMDFAGLVGESWTQWISYVLTAAILFMAYKEYKDQGDGYMELKEGLGIGALFSLVGAALGSVFLGIYAAYINPNYTEAIKQQSIMSMEEQGMSDAQIEQAMEFSSSFMSPTALTIFGLIGGFVIGMIIALIISLIAKKARPEIS